MSAGAAAVIAKARSKYGRFLTADDYFALASKNDVNDIVSELRQKPAFRDDFSAAGSNSVRRKQAEEIMNKRLFRIYMQLRRYVSAKKDGFYYYPIKKEEVKQIIIASMYISTGVQDMFIFQYPVFLNEYSSFDLMALTKAHSFSDMLSVLKNTPYYNVLKPLGGEKDSFPNIRDIENALGHYYYDWVNKAVIKEFSGHERAEIQKCIQRSSDIFNIRLCYRFKGLFKMPSEEVKRNIIPYHYRFSDAAIDRLLSRAESEPILPLILKLPHFRSYKETENPDLEIAIRTSDVHFFRDKLMLSQYDSVVLYSLMGLLEVENKNLTTIIESVRYSLPQSEIKAMLTI